MTTNTLCRTTMDSPVGELAIIASDAGLRAVLWNHEDLRVTVGSEDVVDRPDHPVIVATIAQLGEYFEGTRQQFDLPLDPIGTPFQLATWEVLRTIPYGHTMTYGEQARALGDPNKARAVGAANGKNPLSIIVPCHRVVGANGSLTGFAGGLQNKAWLLDLEFVRRSGSAAG